MVRERVGDWRSAWRSVVAGVAAGLLVIGVLQTGILDGPFFAAQDRLFPAPPPDNGITLVAIDARSKDHLGAIRGATGNPPKFSTYLPGCTRTAARFTECPTPTTSDPDHWRLRPN